MHAAAACALALAACSAAAEPSATRAAGGAPVVVELFTSQGCSSCPPAEKLLTQIAARGTIGGRAVIPLAYHVDYWDDLGWKDPFSSAMWTGRQGTYAASFGTTRVYTPQAVIAGAADALGSDEDAIARAVAAAPAMRAIDATATRTPKGLHVTATAPDGADVWVVVWTDGATTKIARGENAGEELAEDRIVRVFDLVAASGKRDSTDVALDPSWTKIGAVAFAQHRAQGGKGDLAIVGATVLPLDAARR